jgi:hypothetical protein
VFLAEIFTELFWRKWRCWESNLLSVTCGHGTWWNNRIEHCFIIIRNPHGTLCDWTVWSSRFVQILPVKKYSLRSEKKKDWVSFEVCIRGLLWIIFIYEIVVHYYLESPVPRVRVTYYLIITLQLSDKAQMC